MFIVWLAVMEAILSYYPYICGKCASANTLVQENMESKCGPILYKVVCLDCGHEMPADSVKFLVGPEDRAGHYYDELLEEDNFPPF